jgi:lipopolysaccharide/colanic/teichoic acid biosynthesis glycosyltransferase
MFRVFKDLNLSSNNKILKTLTLIVFSIIFLGVIIPTMLTAASNIMVGMGLILLVGFIYFLIR